VSEVNVLKRGSVFFIRFEDGSKAYLAVEEKGNILYLNETFTPEKYRGRGYARRLVEEAIKYAETKGLKIVPICSYAIYYFMKNRDKRYVLKDSYKSLSEDEWRRLFESRLEEERRKS